jgi:hypothetical protein
MLSHYVLAALTLFVLFMLFLVISRTLNNIVNLMIKLEYLLQKECDLKQEALEVRKLMEEQTMVQEEKVQSNTFPVNSGERMPEKK